jgi:hypothetical protein
MLGIQDAIITGNNGEEILKIDHDSEEESGREELHSPPRKSAKPVSLMGKKAKFQTEKLHGFNHLFSTKDQNKTLG